MAEIKNYTLNFAVRRPRFAGWTCAARKSAAAEVELRRQTVDPASVDGIG